MSDNNFQELTVEKFVDMIRGIVKDVLKEEYFGCHPCINTSSLKMKTADIVEKFLPAVHHEYIEVEL